MSEHGIESERGQRSLARMNDMHGRFKISNDDYLYVLSNFIFEPAVFLLPVSISFPHSPPAASKIRRLYYLQSILIKEYQKVFTEDMDGMTHY